MTEYPIDVICVLTIERAIDRHESFLGAAMQPLCGIPPALIQFCIGPDAKVYKNDMQAVAEAAVRDGFAWVEEYALGTQTEYCQQTAASVAQTWAYGRILRYLVDTKQTGLIIWDDKTLTVPFHVFSDILEVLRADENEFYMWQLLLRGHPDEVGLPELDIETRTLRSQSVFSTLIGGAVGSPLDFLIELGIRGYDETIVFSPEGAAWMLKQLETAEAFHTFLDHFICHELSQRVQPAIENGKGIYCPSEYGYQFANVYRPMGTLTNWAHKESPEYEDSIVSVTPNYLHI